MYIMYEFGEGTLHLTEGLQHRREYECSNPTSQTLGTFYDISCKGRAILGADEKNLQYFFAVVG